MGRNVGARSAAARALLVVLAALALVLSGVGDLPPASAGSPAAVAVPDAPERVSSATSPPAAALQLRAAGVAGVPTPTGPAAGLAPGAGPLVAPHLVTEPQSRPPTALVAALPPGAPGSRAPPGPAGT